jgi:hypothetical protein
MTSTAMLCSNQLLTARLPVVARTPYQTLGSINQSYDREKLVTSDRVSFGKHWEKCFFNNTISDGIFEAIAARADSNPELLSRKSEVGSQLVQIVVVSAVCLTLFVFLFLSFCFPFPLDPRD